jgi:murein DD-endopeptidase MepM/ murein hydrolase activator NlpD
VDIGHAFFVFMPFLKRVFSTFASKNFFVANNSSNRKKILSNLLFGILAIAVLIVIVYFTTQNEGNQIIEEIPNPQDTPEPEKPDSLLFGISIDSFDIDHDIIEKNDILSVILSRYNVGMTTVSAIVDSNKDVFDIRKIRANKNFTVFSTKDSLQKARYFVYEENPVDYVVFDFDSLKIYRRHNDVDTIIKSISGIINTSLWVDMVNNGATPLLINKVSDVFAWQVNFFLVNKGDKFKVLYEETVVNGEAVGIGRVIAALFEQSDVPFYAVIFNQNEREDYFDENGDCLRKMFLKAPLSYTRISSGYSNARFHPILKQYRPHHGVDFAAPSGTPVMAVGDGKVTYAAYSGAGGNMVKITHNSVYSTAYLHLSGFGKGIKVGAVVKQGQTIGYVGSTGRSTGPHLDYRVWKNGVNVNPLTLDLPPVESVSDSNIVEFTKVKDSLIGELKKIHYPKED